MSEQLLIIEDSEAESAELKTILGAKYTCLTALGAKEGLKIMEEHW